MSEISAGLKMVKGEFYYAQQQYENTGNWRIVLQPSLRYDYPLPLFRISDEQTYFNLMLDGGLLYISSLIKYESFVDTYTVETISFTTKSPLYLPVNFGVYNTGAFDWV